MTDTPRLPDPHPVPASFYVAVEPQRGWWTSREPISEGEARRDGDEIIQAIKQHVDGVGYCTVAFGEYACPVCGQYHGSFRSALECCSITCPSCRGTGKTDYIKDEDGVLRQHTCPDCNHGHVPDPEQWDCYKGGAS